MTYYDAIYDILFVATGISYDIALRDGPDYGLNAANDPDFIDL